MKSFLHPIFYILLFYSHWIVHEYPTPQWILWNVGQGQWFTYIDEDNCWHFDFGGEKNPIKEVYKYCHWKQNIVTLSHGDRDHYNFFKIMRKNFRRLCLFGNSWSQLNLKKIGALGVEKCNSSTSLLTEESRLFTPLQPLPRPTGKYNRNRDSQIVEINQWLIPGDAPRSLEKKWIHQTQHKNLNSITHLILSHHGSKTSNSEELLQNLPQLIQCAASSRKKKYGHPHFEVIQRLKKYCSLILTEDWNHLHFL